MKTLAIGLVLITTLGAGLAAGQQTQPPLPPNHPTMPQLPAGHPTAPGQPPQQQQLPPSHPPLPGEERNPVYSEDWPTAKAEDVASIEAILAAYYSAISGGKGEARDWDRLRSLMLPEARYFSTRPTDTHQVPIVLTIDQFVEVNRKYFEAGGYYEKQVHEKREVFGQIAHVFSTYEARRNVEQEVPYSRGINSFQLVNDGQRWWIVNILWEYERPDRPIPSEYAGPGGNPPATGR